jgi:glycosyltransferase involved in cell wall biosynthesis
MFSEIAGDRPMTERAAPHVVMLVRNPYTHDTRVEKEARALLEAGYRVTVVADAAPGLPGRESRDGVRVLRVAQPLRKIPGIRFLATTAARILTLLRTDADVYHAHDTNALEAVGVAALRRRVPYVYDSHELWLGRSNRGRRRLYFALSNVYYAVVEHLFVPRASAHITVSPPIARWLEERYRLERVELVGNFPERTEAPTEPRTVRDLPGGDRIPPGAPIVLYLGGLLEGRGLEPLIAALVSLPTAHLVTLGSGALRPVLEALASRLGLDDRVHLLDPVSSDDVVAYSMSATVGVSANGLTCLSYELSLPNKLFQYMAAGIPVVAADYPQFREVVIDHGAGLLADTTDPDSLAQAIGEILEDPGRAAEMGRRGRAAVLESYHWERAADTLRAIYRRLPYRIE